MEKIKENLRQLIREEKEPEVEIFTYYKKIDNNYIYDTYLNQKYGNNREGFTKVKEDYHVEYPKSNMFRAIYDKNKKIISYVQIETISKNLSLKYIKLYEKAHEELIEKLNVKDIEQFEFFIDNYIQVDLVFSGNSFYRSKITELLNLKKKYDKDKDFRDFINKIIS